MSCCGATPDHEDLDAVARLLVGRLGAFVKTLRDNGFAVGLQEGQDAAAVMAAGYAGKPGLLRSAFKHLFAARKSEWDRFDGLFDAFWLGKRVRSRSLVSGAAPAANSPSLKSLQDANAGQSGPQGATDQIPSDDPPRDAGGEGRSEGASRVETLADTDFRRLADPQQVALAHEAAARLARVMRTRLTRRDQVRRKGQRLDLRRTIHRSISHGGVPIALVHRRRKSKPLRLVVLLDASGSMSAYTAVFLRFIHGVLDTFREAEAFLFHTRLAY
ncbi:MAG: VWA domain-containing protein, partial [Bradyrhizobium sp.]|nr:VWA domain-containing protein [Bradyrhizobium sp.]